MNNNPIQPEQNNQPIEPQNVPQEQSYQNVPQFIPHQTQPTQTPQIPQQNIPTPVTQQSTPINQMTNQAYVNYNQTPEQVYQNPNIPVIEEKKKSGILEFILYLGIILGLVFTIRFFVIMPFAVEGNSMEPNFHTGELIIVNRIGYTIGKPDRGDIVVFIPTDNPDTYYIKRIIGLPGESIKFSNGSIYIYNEAHPNGKKVEEPYLSKENQRTNPPANMNNKKIEIPERHYYMLGDNRAQSRDSRVFGPVHTQNLIGKTEVIIYPIKQARLAEDGEYDIITDIKE